MLWMRTALGALICTGAIRFWARGWVEELLVNRGIRLTYYGFGWVPHPGELGCQLLLLVTALAGASMCIGWGGRWCIALAFVSFTWLELVEASTYLNHYYFVSALLLLLCFLPRLPRVDRAWAGAREPDDEVPCGALWAVRVQVAAVYVYAGIAKLNSDWLLEAEPLRTWLMVRSELPLVGPLLGREATAHAFSFFGAVYDLTIVGWLSWRKSRPYAWFAVVVFHVMTAMLFRIGLFPWIMIALSTVFFEPDWPRRLLGRLRRWLGGPASAPVRDATAGSASWSNWRFGVVLALLTSQLLLPLRQWMYPGNRLWHEQGFRFSWNVMLMEKVGHMEFRVRDAAGERAYTTDAEMLLTPLQRKMASTQPDLLLQVAHEVGRRARARGIIAPQVYADVWVALNGRRRQRFVDPSVDLMQVKDGFGPRTWLAPMSAGP